MIWRQETVFERKLGNLTCIRKVIFLFRVECHFGARQARLRKHILSRSNKNCVQRARLVLEIKQAPLWMWKSEWRDEKQDRWMETRLQRPMSTDGRMHVRTLLMAGKEPPGCIRRKKFFTLTKGEKKESLVFPARMENCLIHEYSE